MAFPAASGSNPDVDCDVGRLYLRRHLGFLFVGGPCMATVYVAGTADTHSFRRVEGHKQDSTPVGFKPWAGCRSVVRTQLSTELC